MSIPDSEWFVCLLMPLIPRHKQAEKQRGDPILDRYSQPHSSFMRGKNDSSQKEALHFKLQCSTVHV
uniref:Uncharacterized protein n=1 Tax=Megaselia scalaris TaxID=36166 RepID=T1GLD0_MEGSC